MVHFLPVTQFMNHHIILYRFRTQHQQTVETEISTGTAAAPPGALTADGDTTNRNAHDIRKMADPFRQFRCRLFRQVLQFLRRKDWALGSLGNGFQMFTDPVFLTDYKGMDFPFAALCP